MEQNTRAAEILKSVSRALAEVDEAKSHLDDSLAKIKEQTAATHTLLATFDAKVISGKKEMNNNLRSLAKRARE